MRTLSEIKDQVAQDHGHKDWKDLSRWAHHELKQTVIDAAIKAYALAMIVEDRKDCAEKAAAYTYGMYPPGAAVDKSSILNRPYPEMK